MKSSFAAAAALVLSAPLILGAQTKPTIAPTSSINLSALKPVASGAIAALSGTSLSSVPTYFGATCPTGGCTRITTTAGSTAGVSIKLSDTKTQGSTLGAALLAPHGVDHDLMVLLNGSQVLDAICNAAMELILTPDFRAMGSSTSAFTWEFFDNGKLVKSGKSAGEAIKINVGGAVSKANLYDFDVSSHGVIAIDHGAQRIVMTPADATGIGAKTGGALKFEDLGLRMAGINQFALVSAGLK